MDYYKVLGIESSASLDQIKDAYRKLAKKYHPDVNTTGSIHEPNAEKFRQIAEAYAVLSVSEYKMKYDTSYTKNEEAVFSSSKSKVMEMNRKNRDKTGQASVFAASRGSYAEHRLKQLERERKMFNVSHLGYYNGGVPVKDSQSARGTAWSGPGQRHSSHEHNGAMKSTRESSEIEGYDTAEHNAYQKEDAVIRDRPRPFYKLVVDPNMTYIKNRNFALFLIMGMLLFPGFKILYSRERNRIHRTERLPENLSQQPSHHFVNRGGVLIKKEFVGFSKYFQNDKELTNWFERSYPDVFKKAKQTE